MCKALLCKYSRSSGLCGHARLTIEICDLIRSQPYPAESDDAEEDVKNLNNWAESLAGLHTGPPLTIEIQVPTGSHCLCEQGIKMAPKPDSKIGSALALYRPYDKFVEDSKYVNDAIINPTMEWLRDMHSRTKGVNLPVSSENKPIPKSALNGCDPLLITSAAYYEGEKCYHRVEDFKMPREISCFRSTCPKMRCKGRLSSF